MAEPRRTRIDDGVVMLEPDALLETYGDVYSEAATTGTDMRRFSEAVEEARSRTATPDDPLAHADVLMQAAAQADDDGLAAALSAASRTMVAGACRSLSEHVRSVPPDRRPAAVVLAASCLLVAWEVEGCATFLADAAGETPLEDDAAALAAMLPAIQQGRWSLTGETFGRLADRRDLPARHRAVHLARQGLVELYYTTRLVEARKLIDTAIELADEPEVIASKPLYHKETGKLHLARRLAEEARDACPGYADNYRILAELEQAAEELTAAERWLALARQEVNQGGHLLDAHVSLLADGNWVERRLADLEALAKRHMLVTSLPGLAAAKVARLLADAGRLDDAQRWAEAAIESNAELPAAHQALGYVLARPRDQPDGSSAVPPEQMAAAEKHYAKALAVDELGGADILRDLGLARHGAKRTNEAVAAFASAAERATASPAAAMAHADRAAVAQLRMEAGDESARHDLLALVREAPDSWAALSPLLTRIGDVPLDDARADCETLRATVAPQLHGFFETRLGNRLYDDADSPAMYEEAADAYRRAIAADPEDPVLLRNLAGALRQLGRWDDAVEQVERAFAHDQSERERDIALARIYNAQGNELYARADYAASIRFYERAVEANPANAVYHGNLGNALIELTEPGERVPALRRAVRAYDRAVRAGDAAYGDRLDTASAMLTYARTYGEEALDWIPLKRALNLEVAKDLVEFIADEKGELRSEVDEKLNQNVRGWFWEHFGLAIPGFLFTPADLPPGSYKGYVYGLEVVSARVNATKRLYVGEPGHLPDGVDAEQGVNPFSGRPALWVPAGETERLEQDGLDVWTVPEYLAFHLTRVVLGDLRAFLGYQDVVNLLAELPDADAARFASAEGRAYLTRVLNGLVAERVPIRDLPAISAITSAAQADRSNLSEAIRRVRRSLGRRLPGTDSETAKLPIGDDAEAVFSRSVVDDGAEPVLGLRPDDLLALQPLFQTVRSNPDAALVTTDDRLRPHVQVVLESVMPGMPVLATSELDGAAATALAAVPADAED